MNTHTKKFILYVDNDSQYRETARQALIAGQYKYHLCENAEDALECIEQQSPDLVITDYDLSDVNGEELYMRYLISPVIDGARNIPFIALTTNGHVDRSRLYSLGFSACITKPFRQRDFLDFIEDALVSHELKMEEVHFWETIRESRDFMERVIESSVDAIVTTDTKGYVTFCNRACEELLGIQFEDLIGTRVSEFLKDGVSEMLRISTYMQRKTKMKNYKTSIITKESEEIPVNISISTMKNGEGQVMGVLGICKAQTNIDENIGSDTKPERLAAVVETAVAVNHAINNPLVPILGNAQFLLQSDSMQDEDTRRRLRIIVNNALRIRDITQKLAKITNPVQKEYLQGIMMLDIDGSC
ncbi:PAS domain S-box protein [bacterium]|nr:PAS domain S-box protein [bacterium]